MVRPIFNVVRDVRRASRVSADTRSAVQLSADFAATRVLRHMGLDRKRKLRSITLNDGIAVHYRLNSGDVQSIREVLLDECYRLPFEIMPRTVVDLGANIGLATLWFWHRWHPTHMVAVEASPSNAQVARKNFESNGIRVELLEAAVGPQDGTCSFVETDASNVGRVSATGGLTRRMVSMKTVMGSLPPGSLIDVVKMDIEGGEEPLLLEGDTSWIDRVRSFIVEFHPDAIDRPRLIRSLIDRGFRYVPPNTVFQDNYESFVREAT